MKDKLLNLYKEMIDVTTEDPEEKKFTVHRHCKVENVDVKLLLRLEVILDLNSDNMLAIQSKISVVTESTTLRKYKSYYNDSEYYKVRSEPVYLNKASELYAHNLETHVKSVLDGFLVFRICKICRLLYKDPRKDTEDVCKNCIFDNCFYLRQDSCVVCQEQYKPNEYTFPLTCGHVYHSKCILQQFLVKKKRECPICKELDSHQPA